MSLTRLAAGVAAFALLVGCASRRPPQAPWPAEFDTAAALERVRAAGEAPVWCDGVLRLSGHHRRARLRARAVIVVEPGGRFYLETTGRPAFVLASDGAEIRALLTDQRQWLRGPATAATVEALIGLALTPAELGALVAGIGATPELLATARPAAAGLVVVDGGELRLEPVAGRIVAGSLRGIAFTLDPLAARLQVTSTAAELTLDIHYPTAPPGRPRAPELFRPIPPAGFRELAIDELQRPVLLPSGDE